MGESSRNNFHAIRQVANTTSSTPLQAFSSGIKSGVSKVSGMFTPPPREPQGPTSLGTEANPSPQLYLAVARLAEQNGQFVDAENRYRQALSMAPQNLSVLLGYARMKNRQGRYDEAIQWYRETARVHPNDPIVFNDLGLCHARRNELNEAVTAIGRAIQLAPKEPLYRNNIATVLVERGDVNGAFQQLATVHDQAVAYYNIGYLLHKKGESRMAASLFAKALEVNPSLNQARAWLDRLNGPSGPQDQSMPTNRAENFAVHAPDPRTAVQQSSAVPRMATRSGPPTSVTPRPIPSTDSAAGAQSHTLRQLPPVVEIYHTPITIVPQSYEDPPLPQETNERPNAPLPNTSLLAPLPTPLANVPAPSSQRDDTPVPASLPDDAIPAPLPDGLFDGPKRLSTAPQPR